MERGGRSWFKMPKRTKSEQSGGGRTIRGLKLLDRIISRRHADLQEVQECNSCGIKPSGCNTLEVAAIIPHRWNTWETYKVPLPKPNVQWFNPNCPNKCFNLWEVVGISKSSGYLSESGSTKYQRFAVSNVVPPLRETPGRLPQSKNINRLPIFDAADVLPWVHTYPNTSRPTEDQPKMGPNLQPFDWNGLAEGVPMTKFYDWKSEVWKRNPDIWYYEISDITGNGQLAGQHTSDPQSGAADKWPTQIGDVKGKQGVTAVERLQKKGDCIMFPDAGTCFEDPDHVYYTVLNAEGRPWTNKTTGSEVASSDAGVGHFEEVSFLLKLTKWCVKDLAERALADWVEKVNPNSIYPSPASVSVIQYPSLTAPAPPEEDDPDACPRKRKKPDEEESPEESSETGSVNGDHFLEG